MNTPASVRVHEFEKSLFAIASMKMMWQVKVVVVGFLVLVLRKSAQLLLRCRPT